MFQANGFNFLDEALEKYTDKDGIVNWRGLIDEMKAIGSMFAGKEMGHGPKNHAMEEMMKKWHKSSLKRLIGVPISVKIR